MGIDLATWRARIGLNYYHMCRSLQTRWRSSGGQLHQPGLARWGVGEIMNYTPLVLKGCMTVVALSLILHYVVCKWPKLKGRGDDGKVHCNWWQHTFRMRCITDGGRTLLLRTIVVVIPLLLLVAGDVETNPGPEGTFVTLGRNWLTQLRWVTSVAGSWPIPLPTFSTVYMFRTVAQPSTCCKTGYPVVQQVIPLTSFCHAANFLLLQKSWYARLFGRCEDAKKGIHQFYLPL